MIQGARRTMVKPWSPLVVRAILAAIPAPSSSAAARQLARVVGGAGVVATAAAAAGGGGGGVVEGCGRSQDRLHVPSFLLVEACGRSEDRLLGTSLMGTARVFDIGHTSKLVLPTI